MQEQFILEETLFTNKRILYEFKYLEDCLYNCLDTSGKKIAIIFWYYCPK